MASRKHVLPFNKSPVAAIKRSVKVKASSTRDAGSPLTRVHHANVEGMTEILNDIRERRNHQEQCGAHHKQEPARRGHGQRKKCKNYIMTQNLMAITSRGKRVLLAMARTHSLRYLQCLESSRPLPDASPSLPQLTRALPTAILGSN